MRGDRNTNRGQRGENGFARTVVEDSMDNGFQFIDIILLAMVAGFIALRLRSVLGRRTGEEPPPREVLEHGRVAADGAVLGAGPGLSEAVQKLESDTRMRRALREIRQADPDFDVDRFLEGAKAAYSLILEAFWSGDKETLKRFLNDDVYEQFVSVIDERAAAGHTLEARIVDLVGVEITDLTLRGRMVEVSVTYRAEIVSVTRDREGRLISGNPPADVLRRPSGLARGRSRSGARGLPEKLRAAIGVARCAHPPAAGCGRTGRRPARGMPCGAGAGAAGPGGGARLLRTPLHPLRGGGAWAARGAFHRLLRAAC